MCSLGESLLHGNFDDSDRQEIAGPSDQEVAHTEVQPTCVSNGPGTATPTEEALPELGPCAVCLGTYEDGCS